MSIVENYIEMLRRERAVSYWLRYAHSNQMHPVGGIDYRELAKRATRIVHANNTPEHITVKNLMTELDVECPLIASTIYALVRSMELE
jgi:hypothetical protein